MAALVTSLLVLIVGTAMVFYVGSRRPPGTVPTWGEAVLGAVAVFALLLLAYAVVPNQFLAYADNELKWRPDRIAYIVRFWGRGKITITKQTVRDFIAVGIYVVMLGSNVALWSRWQKRGVKKPPEAPAIETSAFGRPLVRKV